MDLCHCCRSLMSYFAITRTIQIHILSLTHFSFSAITFFFCASPIANANTFHRIESIETERNICLHYFLNQTTDKIMFINRIVIRIVIKISIFIIISLVWNSKSNQISQLVAVGSFVFFSTIQTSYLCKKHTEKCVRSIANVMQNMYACMIRR